MFFVRSKRRDCVNTYSWWSWECLIGCNPLLDNDLLILLNNLTALYPLETIISERILVSIRVAEISSANKTTEHSLRDTASVAISCQLGVSFL